MNLFISKQHSHPPAISHTRSVYENFGIPKSVKNSLSEINTGDPVFIVRTSMDGTQQAIYHVNFIHLLDKVFLHDNLDFISPEQERFINRFFKQAHTVTQVLDNNITNSKTDDPFAEMDSILRELDNFLGSYFGVDHGRFAR